MTSNPVSKMSVLWALGLLAVIPGQASSRGDSQFFEVVNDSSHIVVVRFKISDAKEESRTVPPKEETSIDVTFAGCDWWLDADTGEDSAFVEFASGKVKHRGGKLSWGDIESTDCPVKADNWKKKSTEDRKVLRVVDRDCKS